MLFFVARPGDSERRHDDTVRGRALERPKGAYRSLGFFVPVATRERIFLRAKTPSPSVR
jgi:hypothetical protein